MKQTILLLLALTASSVIFAQKQDVDIDGDTIKVNKAPYAIIEKKGAAAPIYTIKSMSGTPLMNWQFLDFNDHREVNNSNPNGRVTYYQVTFFNDQQQCEIRPRMVTQKGVAKCIVENALVKDGMMIDQTNENNFVLVNGKKFSAQQQSSGNGTTVIINNNR